MATNEELAIALARIEEQVKNSSGEHKKISIKLDKITDDHEYRIRHIENATWKNRLALVLLTTVGGGTGAWIVKLFGLSVPPPGAG